MNILKVSNDIINREEFPALPTEIVALINLEAWCCLDSCGATSVG